MRVREKWDAAGGREGELERGLRRQEGAGKKENGEQESMVQSDRELQEIISGLT